MEEIELYFFDRLNFPGYKAGTDGHIYSFYKIPGFDYPHRLTEVITKKGKRYVTIKGKRYNVENLLSMVLEKVEVTEEKNI